MDNKNSNIEENEIDIREIINVLKRRNEFITTAGFVFISVVSFTLFFRIFNQSTRHFFINK